jgi:hypothetical protein
MEYSEELIADLLQDWKSKGYTDTIIIDHGFLFAVNLQKYFPLSMMKEDNRVNIYDEYLSGSAWSMHALTLGNSCKGILILGGEIYNPWELTQEIIDAFDMPMFSSDYQRKAS